MPKTVTISQIEHHIEALPMVDQLRDHFDDSSLPFQVDIVEWATTSGEFRAIIMATAVQF